MSGPAEDVEKEDIPQEEASEESKYRSYYDTTGKKAKAAQKFKIGRIVWFKTDFDGSFAMRVTDAVYNPGPNTWSYKLTDSMGEPHEGWVPETRLTAASPNK